MKHYYQDDAVTIYHGDCREIVPELGQFDLLWSDPPYNVGKDYGNYNDSMPLDDYFAFCQQWIDLAKKHCLKIAIYPPKKHLLWFMNRLPEHHIVVCTWRPFGAIRYGFSHQYVPILMPQPVTMTKDHWENVQVPACGYFFEEHTYGHPGYTSYDITTRVLNSCTESGNLIVDFFGGTGTTGRAAKDLGRRAVLIEQEEKYCEISAKRMAQEVFNFST